MRVFVAMFLLWTVAAAKMKTMPATLKVATFFKDTGDRRQELNYKMLTSTLDKDENVESVKEFKTVKETIQKGNLGLFQMHSTISNFGSPTFGDEAVDTQFWSEVFVAAEKKSPKLIYLSMCNSDVTLHSKGKQIVQQDVPAEFADEFVSLTSLSKEDQEKYLEQRELWNQKIAAGTLHLAQFTAPCQESSSVKVIIAQPGTKHMGGSYFDDKQAPDSAFYRFLSFYLLTGNVLRGIENVKTHLAPSVNRIACYTPFVKSAEFLPVLRRLHGNEDVEDKQFWTKLAVIIGRMCKEESAMSDLLKLKGSVAHRFTKLMGHAKKVVLEATGKGGQTYDAEGDFAKVKTCLDRIFPSTATTESI